MGSAYNYYYALPRSEREEERESYQREIRDLWSIRNRYPVRAAIRNATSQLRLIALVEKEYRVFDEQGRDVTAE